MKENPFRLRDNPFATVDLDARETPVGAVSPTSENPVRLEQVHGALLTDSTFRRLENTKDEG